MFLSNAVYIGLCTLNVQRHTTRVSYSSGVVSQETVDVWLEMFGCL